MAPKGFHHDTTEHTDDKATTASGGEGVVEDIYISPESAAPMERRTVAKRISGVGIDGDRYALGKGTYSASFLSEPGRNLTMVSSDAVEEAMAKTNMQPFEYRSQLRRNVVIRGVT